MMKRMLAAGMLLTAFADPALARGNPTPQFHVEDVASDVARAVRSIPGAIGRVLASFYGAKGEHLNKHAANGSVFDPAQMTAAHRTMPFGTKLLVTLGVRNVVVTVTDRGPAAWTHRDLDLSYGAAKRLGFIQRGTAVVHVAILP